MIDHVLHCSPFDLKLAQGVTQNEAAVDLTLNKAGKLFPYEKET